MAGILLRMKPPPPNWVLTQRKLGSAAGPAFGYSRGGRGLQWLLSRKTPAGKPEWKADGTVDVIE